MRAWLRDSGLLGLIRTDRTIQFILVLVVVLLAWGAYIDESSCWVAASDLDTETRFVSDANGAEVELLYVRVENGQCQ